MKKIITTFTVLASLALFINNSYAGYFNNTQINRCNNQITSYLSFGSSGDEVLILQKLLSASGYLSAYPNGYFGNATKAAVKNFQRDNYVSQTGSLGQTTRDLVNERLCDDFSSYGSSYSYGYNSSVTYVDEFDLYVKVVSPNGVYSNNSNNYYNQYSTLSTDALVPATVQSSLTQANIIYNPLVGYTYALVPTSASLTISSPGSSSSFHEGDTVNLKWYTNNITALQYVISLENVSTGRVKDIALASTNDHSFVLTKEILDYVCAGVCNQYSQSKFNIIVSTPIKDMAGNITSFKAKVSDVTIIRPYFLSSNVSLTAGKSPVNSGELFRLYINILNNSYYNWNNSQTLPYSFGISATCTSGVSVSVGGLNCGQEFAMPQTSSYTQREIPVAITNNGWFSQNVIFNLTAYDQLGRVIGSASTTVIVHPVARGW